MNETNTALVTNDAVVLGILMAILAFIFYTSGSKISFWNNFTGSFPVSCFVILFRRCLIRLELFPVKLPDYTLWLLVIFCQPV